MAKVKANTSIKILDVCYVDVLEANAVNGKRMPQEWRILLTKTAQYLTV